MRYPKQRGQKRKLKKMISRLNKIMIPYENTTRAYDKFIVPSLFFLSSPKTNGKIKTAYCKAMLEKTAEIIEKKPEHIPFCKIVALIAPDEMWSSQIIFFYDETYYNLFWERNTPWQTWVPLEDTNKSFVKERNIKTALKEKGYIENLCDEDIQRKSVLWFYGEIQ